MSFWLQIVVLLGLLFLSGFFSGSETALTSLGKLRSKRILTELDEVEETFGKNLKYWLDNSRDILISILIWNNLVNIAASSLATVVAVNFFRRTLGYGESMAWGSGTAVGIMTFLILLFGEITPKSYAESHPEQFARQIIRPVIFFTLIASPVIYVLRGLAVVNIRIFGGDLAKRQNRITEEELKKLVLAGRKEGTLEETELKMLHSVFEFDETIVREIMVPRTDVVALEVNSSQEQVLKVARRSGLSRIPVYEDKLDNVVGILNIKDFITKHDSQSSDPFDLRDLVRPPYFVPETKRVNKLLANFRRHRVHMAVVVDEYGGTSGIITLEDILEEIVGEIEDEYDDQREWVTEVEDKVYLVDARIDLDDLEERLGNKLPTRKYDSLGGMIIEEMGKIPGEGEKMIYEGSEYKVTDATQKQVKEVKLDMEGGVE